MNKEIENTIDELISEGKNTPEIITELKKLGISNEDVQEIMTEYNKKSLSLNNAPIKGSWKKILIFLLLVILAMGVIFYFISQNNKLSSSDQYGRIYYKTLPDDIRNFKKCSQEDLFGKWEYKYSSVDNDKVARVIFNENGQTYFSSISNLEGGSLTVSSEDAIEMVEIGLKNVPPERYMLKDGMIFTDVGTGWVPIICLFATGPTNFMGINVNKGEILNVVSNENQILLFDVLSPVSI